MIESMAVRLTNTLVRNNTIYEEQKNMYIYGFELFVSATINCFLILLVGLLFDKLIFTVFFVIQYYPIKKTCGGYHANTYRTCIISFTIIYSLILFIQTKYNITLNMALVVGWLFGFFLILFFAPVEDLKKPLEMQDKRRLKKKSVCLYILFSVINIIILCFFNDKCSEYALYGIIALNLIALMMLGGILKNYYKGRRVEYDKNGYS